MIYEAYIYNVVASYSDFYFRSSRKEYATRPTKRVHVAGKRKENVLTAKRGGEGGGGSC